MSMASHRLGSEASAQIHSRPQVPRDSCSCNLCWSHHRNHGSSSPSCPKTLTSDHSCLQQEPNINELFRHRFHPSRLAQQASHPAAPCQHFDSRYLPRTPLSDGAAAAAACAHEAFPASTWFSTSRFNQEKRQEQKNVRMDPPSLKGHGASSAQPSQITLHRWYLVRHGGSSEGVQMSVGGFFGTAGMERFETAAIVQRLEKCRLLAQDGVEVLLAGLIDDCTTVSNGFSLNLVQSFLSGFPYTWNHLLDNESCTSSTNHQDHQVLGDCGLSAVAGMSQPSFEGCCTEKTTPSLSQKEVCCDHLETPNNMGLNIKQNMTADARTEKETKDLSTQAASKDNENLESGILKDDQLTKCNFPGDLEQDVLDSSITTEEELPENISVDHSNVKKKPGRASKALPHSHLKRGEVGTGGDTQDGTGNTSFLELNRAPRITRSMHKLNRHAARGNNFSNGAKTITQAGSLSNSKDLEHTFEEEIRPCGELRFCSFSSPLIQKSVGEDSQRRSSKILSEKNNRDKVDAAKASNKNPCHHTEGVESPVEVEMQRPERSLNVEASLKPKDGCSSIQEDECVTDALPENGCNAEAEKADLPIFVQKSESLESKTTSNSVKKDKQSNKEGNVSTRSSGHYSKRPNSLPPLPCPRVPVSKQLISQAFGLKTSRSGRLLVPPLAHWCGQSLLRDKDGGIIAISDGSKDMNNSGTGSFKFKPPPEAGLQKLQKRLCEVATDRTPSKKQRAFRISRF